MSKTVVWSSDTGDVVEIDGERREKAIRALLDDIAEPPASAEIETERRIARLRWSDPATA
ncbi:hypothetical protein [Microbacterium sp.]|uniref:hypothetical protein n=1 Tax=Microbacterium sp. TaxID=51671 RepID=UPI003A83FF93